MNIKSIKRSSENSRTHNRRLALLSRQLWSGVQALELLCWNPRNFPKLGRERPRPCATGAPHTVILPLVRLIFSSSSLSLPDPQ